jgi:hypothetical protein
MPSSLPSLIPNKPSSRLRVLGGVPPSAAALPVSHKGGAGMGAPGG